MQAQELQRDGGPLACRAEGRPTVEGLDHDIKYLGQLRGGFGFQDDLNPGTVANRPGTPRRARRFGVAVVGNSRYVRNISIGNRGRPQRLPGTPQQKFGIPANERQREEAENRQPRDAPPEYGGDRQGRAESPKQSAEREPAKGPEEVRAITPAHCRTDPRP